MYAAKHRDVFPLRRGHSLRLYSLPAWICMTARWLRGRMFKWCSSTQSVCISLVYPVLLFSLMASLIDFSGGHVRSVKSRQRLAQLTKPRNDVNLTFVLVYLHYVHWLMTKVLEFCIQANLSWPKKHKCSMMMNIFKGNGWVLDLNQRFNHISMYHKSVLSPFTASAS